MALSDMALKKHIILYFQYIVQKSDLFIILMAKSNITSLFHYTSNMKALSGILSEGLKFSYCEEELYGIKIGIPMICLCDIHPSQTIDHRIKYGSFCIGLNIESLLSNSYSQFLNPVMYCHSDYIRKCFEIFSKNKTHLLLEALKENEEHFAALLEGNLTIDRPKADNYNFFSHAQLLLKGYLKPFIGLNKKGETVNYDEKEWRYIIPHKNEFEKNRFGWLLTDKDWEVWEKFKTHTNCKLLPGSIKFKPEDVTHIIVPDSTELTETVRYLSNMAIFCGQQITDSQKKDLIKKIISFERIDTGKSTF